MCHFLPVYYLGIVFLGRVEGQNITPGFCILHSVNTLGKRKNQTILPPTMGKIGDHTRIFKLGTAKRRKTLNWISLNYVFRPAGAEGWVTHTHTPIYIYIYIYILRERERKRERERRETEWVGFVLAFASKPMCVYTWILLLSAWHLLITFLHLKC